MKPVLEAVPSRTGELRKFSLTRSAHFEWEELESGYVNRFLIPESVHCDVISFCDCAEDEVDAIPPMEQDAIPPASAQTTVSAALDPQDAIRLALATECETNGLPCDPAARSLLMLILQQMLNESPSDVALPTIQLQPDVDVDTELRRFYERIMQDASKYFEFSIEDCEINADWSLEFDSKSALLQSLYVVAVCPCSTGDQVQSFSYIFETELSRHEVNSDPGHWEIEFSPGSHTCELWSQCCEIPSGDAFAGSEKSSFLAFQITTTPFDAATATKLSPSS